MTAAVMRRSGVEALDERCAEIVARLEEAGRTLLALGGGTGPNARVVAAHEVVRAVIEAYGWSLASLRPAVPSAVAIDRMDEAYAWLALLPAHPPSARYLVARRSLVHPVTGRHLVSWRACARELGCGEASARRWHAEAIRSIAISLARPAHLALCPRSL